MEKRISYSQFQSVKRVAQACDPLMVKREKVKEKIEKLAAEYKDYDTQIKSLEAGIVQVIGCRVEDIVKKVIEPGVDVNGKTKKTTKYLPTDIVSYDENHKQYVITLTDPENTANPSAEGKDTETPSGKDNMETPTEEPTTDAVTENKDSQTVEGDGQEIPTDTPIFE